MTNKTILSTLIIIACTTACLSFLFHQHQHALITDDQYLATLYPLLPANKRDQISTAHLNFYYHPMPESIADELKHFKPTKPAQKNGLYCLSWMNACGNMPLGTIFRNTYPKQKTQAAPLIEVMHYGWYNEPGIFFYHATGTGIFLSVGKTLIARNKVDALRQLGLSNLQILAISNYYISSPPHPRFQHTYVHIKAYAKSHHLNFETALKQVMNHIIENDDYPLNRIANSSSYDFQLYQLCRQNHYSTIELTHSPNDNGGWGDEILDCRTSFRQPLMARWKQEKTYLKQCDPLNLKHCQPCDAELPITPYLKCRQSPIA